MMWLQRDDVTQEKKDDVTDCNTLQHSTAHCNTLRHTATHCNTLQHMMWLKRTEMTGLQQVPSVLKSEQVGFLKGLQAKGTWLATKKLKKEEKSPSKREKEENSEKRWCGCTELMWLQRTSILRVRVCVCVCVCFCVCVSCVHLCASPGTASPPCMIIVSR